MEKDLVKTEKQDVIVGSAVDLTSGDNLPNLDKATVIPLSLGGEYWTPEKEGETKRVFFDTIRTQQVTNINGGGELIDLECVFLLEQDKELNTKSIYNGSVRLVGMIQPFVDSGMISRGTPLEITYTGKKKNKNNNFQSDTWSVKPLKINI